jgi:DNA topoisomerase-1
MIEVASGARCDGELQPGPLQLCPRHMQRRATQAGPLAQSLGAARQAGLHYVSDTRAGIRRLRRGKSFSFVDAHGRPIRDPDQVFRIRKLAIPPAWRDVWICPDPQGHVQATGRDVRGRKQYRYHPRWREVRDETKYHRMLAFGMALPKIRARTARDLLRQGLPREKVLATVVRLLETTLIRIGNDEYARANRSFGLTTLRDRHVSIRGAHVRFEFRGKSGIAHGIDLHDKRLARIIQQCRDLPGQELIQYVDEAGTRHTVGSTEVNAYLREIAGDDFTAKDFRTWAGTVLAARALRELAPFSSQRRAKRNVVEAVEAVAMILGNTRSVCRKCYIHPQVVDAYFDGTLIEALNRRARGGTSHGLRRDEAAVFAFLKRKLAADAARLQGSTRTQRAQAASGRRTRRGGDRALKAAS